MGSTGGAGGGHDQPLTCLSRVWRCRGCSDEMASGQTEYPKPPGRPLRNHIPNCVGLKSAFDKLNEELMQSNMRTICASDLLKAFSAWPFDRGGGENVAVPANFECKNEGIYVCGCLILEALPYQDCRLCKGCVPNKYRPMNRFKKGKSRCCYHGAPRVNLLNQDLAVAGIGTASVPVATDDALWRGLIPEPYRPPGGTVPAPPLPTTQSAQVHGLPSLSTIDSTPMHMMLHDEGLRAFNSVPLGQQKNTATNRVLPPLPMPGMPHRSLPRSPFVVQASLSAQDGTSSNSSGPPASIDEQKLSKPGGSSGMEASFGYRQNRVSDGSSYGVAGPQPNSHLPTLSSSATEGQMHYANNSVKQETSSHGFVDDQQQQQQQQQQHFFTLPELPSVLENHQQQYHHHQYQPQRQQPPQKQPSLPDCMMPLSSGDWGSELPVGRMDSRVLSNLSALIGPPSFSNQGSDVWKQQWLLAQEVGQQMLTEDTQPQGHQVGQQPQGQQLEAHPSGAATLAQLPAADTSSPPGPPGQSPETWGGLPSIAATQGISLAPAPTPGEGAAASLQDWSQEAQLEFYHREKQLKHEADRVQLQQRVNPDMQAVRQAAPQAAAPSEFNVTEAPQSALHDEADEVKRDSAALQKEWLEEMPLVEKRKGLQRSLATRTCPEDVQVEQEPENDLGPRFSTDNPMLCDNSFTWSSFNIKRDLNLSGRAMSIDLESWLSLTLERNMSISDFGSPRTMSTRQAVASRLSNNSSRGMPVGQKYSNQSNLSMPSFPWDSPLMTPRESHAGQDSPPQAGSMDGHQPLADPSEQRHEPNRAAFSFALDNPFSPMAQTSPGRPPLHPTSTCTKKVRSPGHNRFQMRRLASLRQQLCLKAGEGDVSAPEEEVKGDVTKWLQEPAAAVQACGSGPPSGDAPQQPSLQDSGVVQGAKVGAVSSYERRKIAIMDRTAGDEVGSMPSMDLFDSTDLLNYSFDTFVPGHPEQQQGQQPQQQAQQQQQQQQQQAALSHSPPPAANFSYPSRTVTTSSNEGARAGAAGRGESALPGGQDLRTPLEALIDEEINSGGVHLGDRELVHGLLDV